MVDHEHAIAIVSPVTSIEPARAPSASCQGAARFFDGLNGRGQALSENGLGR